MSTITLFTTILGGCIILWLILYIIGIVCHHKECDDDDDNNYR